MLDQFINAHPAQGVYYIGHASALVRMAGFHILLDPIWKHRPYGDYWTFVPPQIDCDIVLPITDAVIVSHIHEDHLCEPVLSRLPKDARISLMGGRERFAARLRNIRPLRRFKPFYWQSLIPNAVDVMFVPHAFNNVDSSCFLRSRIDGYTVYHGNDNFLSLELIELVQKNVDRVDVAMVPYSFVHWYPQCMAISPEEKSRENGRLAIQSLMQAQAFIAAFQPKITIPFGNSIFYDDGPNHPLNRELATPFHFRRATPLFAGDYVLGDQVHRVLQDDPEYREMQQHYLTRRQLPMRFSDGVPLASPDNLLQRVESATFGVSNHDLVVNGICIALDSRRVTLGHQPGPGARPYTRFDLSEEIFEPWLRGEMTFEEALGTRRFICRREPNLYNQRVFAWMNEFL